MILHYHLHELNLQKYFYNVIRQCYVCLVITVVKEICRRQHLLYEQMKDKQYPAELEIYFLQ